ncbi:hypothetical protein [Dechloromonas hortensis]|nr:hypothetical protein [Dechloromonas hortensis]
MGYLARKTLNYNGLHPPPTSKDQEGGRRRFTAGIERTDEIAKGVIERF